MFEEQYPPPPGYEPPELKAQLKSSTVALSLVTVLINLLVGYQLWRMHQAERVSRDMMLILSTAGLLLIDLMCVALIVHARCGKE